MKKIQIPIIIFLFTIIVVSYVGFFRESSDTKYRQETSGNYSESFGSDADYSPSKTPGDSGGFFRDSSADNPGGRPDNGGGIGQEAPVGDGLLVLVTCCVALGAVKFFIEKRKNG